MFGRTTRSRITTFRGRVTVNRTASATVTRSRSAASRSTRTTSAPYSCGMRAHSNPIPEAAPVTAASFPDRSWDIAGLLSRARPWLERDLRATESTMTAMARTAPEMMKRNAELRFRRVSPLETATMTSTPRSADHADPRPPKSGVPR